MAQGKEYLYVRVLTLIQNRVKSGQFGFAMVIFVGVGIYILHMLNLLDAHEYVKAAFTGVSIAFVLIIGIFLAMQGMSSIVTNAIVLPPETGQPRQAPPVTETADPPKETVGRASMDERSERDTAPQPQPLKGAPGDSSRDGSGRSGPPQRTDGDGSDRSRHHKGSGGNPPSTSSETPTAESSKPPLSSEERARLQKLAETA